MGSSPLTRGKLLRVRQYAVHDRLIPAHAGKTRDPARGCGVDPAHPRSRGENDGGGSAEHAREGSSPLTRGKRRGRPRRGSRLRLIPAHAGKTTRTVTSHRSVRAHPRSRGENVHACDVQAARAGSSPLTRGKRCAWVRQGRALGLIPAHAGKTSEQPSTRRPRAAHPRSRGENIIGSSLPLR